MYDIFADFEFDKKSDFDSHKENDAELRWKDIINGEARSDSDERNLWKEGKNLKHYWWLKDFSVSPFQILTLVNMQGLFSENGEYFQEGRGYEETS